MTLKQPLPRGKQQRRMPRGTEPGQAVDDPRQPSGLSELRLSESRYHTGIKGLSIDYRKLLGASFVWGQRAVPIGTYSYSMLLSDAHRLGKLTELGRRVRHAIYASFQSRARQIVVEIHPWELLGKDLYCRFMPLGRIAHNIVLDIADSPLLLEIPDIDRRIMDLRQLGYRICASGVDFGTRGSTVLRFGRIDFIRPAAHCIDGIENFVPKRALLTQLVQHAHDYGCSVIATPSQNRTRARLLRQLGCDVIESPKGQSKPMIPTEAFGEQTPQLQKW